MSNLAKKIESEERRERRENRQPELLVNSLSGNKEDRRWYWDFLRSIFQSPDMDLSQFEHYENKRSPQSMRKNEHY